MTRAEMMRQARNAVQVTFSEYLKIRTPDAQMLVFEGKHCPTFYINRVTLLLGGRKIRQLVARGKKNVLELRELIGRNLSTARDQVFFFVDRDFDQHPEPGEFHNVYVTRGYSIENECASWTIVELFIRANFDIADADDENAVSLLQNDFEMVADLYRDAAKKLNGMIFACRRNSIDCLPGDDVKKFLEIDFGARKVRERFDTLMDLASELNIPEEKKILAIEKMPLSEDFEHLDWRLQWRGKYHFDFIRMFLIWVAAARTAGAAPFKRAAKTTIDPSHSGLMGLVFAVVPTPFCLIDFLSMKAANQYTS